MIRPVVVALAALWAAGCGEPAPPIILAHDLPGATRDPVGPYLATAVIDGAEAAAVVWQGPAEPEARAPMADVGPSWEGHLPGLPVGTTVRVWIEAGNAGGVTRTPPATFAVLPPDGACLVDGECLTGEICSGGRCRVPPPECRSDADCAMDLYCPVPGEPCRFRPTRCAVDDDCAAGDVCLDGRCGPRPQCVDDGGCPDGRCVDGRCVPDAACAADGDCPAGQACFERACRDRCIRDSQCPDGQTCREMACVPADVLACPGGCPDGLRCLPSEARCVSCTADGHCPGGHCDLQAWACAPGERGRPCVPCGPQTPCGAGHRCPADVGAACVPLCDPSCRAGLGCEAGLCRVPADRFCGGPVCEVDDDCDSRVCLSGWCEPRQHCALDADCADGRLCADGRCVFRAAACRRPGDCDAGELCLGGRCSPGRPSAPCGRCTFDHDCPSPSLCAPFEDGVRRCAALCGDECPGEALQCLVVDDGLLVCLTEDGRCPQEACGADPFEPDDDRAAATPMPVGATYRGQLCARDVDWLRLQGPEGALFVVQTAGVLRLSVWGDEVLRRTLDVPAGGEVQLVMPVLPVDVELSTTANGAFGWVATLGPPAAPDCDDDGFEEDDAPDRATVIGGGADVRSVACPGDDDWYRLRTRRRAGAVLVDGPAGAVLDTRLFDVNERALDAARGAGQLELQVPQDHDEVLILVRCSGCADGVGYRLRTQLE